MIAKYQEVLGLDPSGHYSNSDYKKRYRDLAMTHHPDKGGDEQRFKEITEAYEILTGKRQPPRNEVPPPGPHFDFGSIEDLFGFGFRRPQTGRPFRAAQRPAEHDRDIGVGFNLSLEEIRAGKTISIEYEKSKNCNDCNGVGGEKEVICNICNGTGSVRQTQQHGNISFSTEYPCHQCGGAGSRIENPCNACHGHGFVVYRESMIVEVKERK
jgi:DnaJ-class molecular chaperone